jgi:hypothetical protein
LVRAASGRGDAGEGEIFVDVASVSESDRLSPNGNIAEKHVLFQYEKKPGYMETQQQGSSMENERNKESIFREIFIHVEWVIDGTIIMAHQIMTLTSLYKQ